MKKITLYYDGCRQFDMYSTKENNEEAVQDALSSAIEYNKACLEKFGAILNTGLQKIEIKEFS